MKPRGRRVLLVTPQPFFESRGTPIALRHVILALRELGYGVDVLSFPLGQPPAIEGVRYFRSANPLGYPSVRIGFSCRKVVLDLFLWLELRRRLRADDYAYVHAVEEAAFAAVFACHPTRTPVLYDMASSLPEQLGQLAIFRPARPLLDRLEGWLLRRVDQVVCSSGLEDRVGAVARDTPCQFWVYPSGFAEAAPRAIDLLRRKLRIPDGAKVVVYAGSFADYQGLPELAAAIPLVLAEEPETCFVLVGAASEEEMAGIENRLPSWARDRVRIESRVEADVVPIYLALADVLVSPRMHGGNLPLKLFDYLAASGAIVATEIPAHRVILDESLARLVAPTAEGLAHGMVDLLGAPGRRERLARAARSFADSQLGWNRFVDIVRNTIPGRPMEGGSPPMMRRSGSRATP